MLSRDHTCPVVASDVDRCNLMVRSIDDLWSLAFVLLTTMFGAMLVAGLFLWMNARLLARAENHRSPDVRRPLAIAAALVVVLSIGLSFAILLAVSL